MIVDTQNLESSLTNQVEKEDFLNKLTWKEGDKGKWYLDKRECLPAETNINDNIDVISIASGNFDEETDESRKIQESNTVLSDLGKLIVAKIEDNQVFLQMEGDQIPVPIESVKKYFKLNFLVLGKTKNFLIEGVEVTLCSEVGMLKKLAADYLSVPHEIIQLHLKESILTDECIQLHTLELNEGDTILVSFTSNQEVQFKRSTSKDYTWGDQKTVIPFTVDKNITVSGFGFFRNYETSLTAVYDYFLYEMKSDGSKSLITQLLNVSVSSTEVDNDFVKKVNCSPVILKADVKYQAYVYYKIADMRTYYSYSGIADQTLSGVRFLFTEISEEGHRSSSTSGHMPHIYFKIYNPYEE